MVALLFLAPATSVLLALFLFAASRLFFGLLIIVRGFVTRIARWQRGAWQAVSLLLIIILGAVATYIVFMPE